MLKETKENMEAQTQVLGGKQDTVPQSVLQWGQWVANWVTHKGNGKMGSEL